MDNNLEIKIQKVLVCKMIEGLLDGLDDLGFMHNTKRSKLIDDLKSTAKLLHRELDRCVTKSEVREVKDELATQLVTKGKLPNSVKFILMESLENGVYV
jgi:hypothetical protein